MSGSPESPWKLTSSSYALFYLCPPLPDLVTQCFIYPRAKLDSGFLLNTSLSYTTDLHTPYSNSLHEPSGPQIPVLDLQAIVLF